MEALAGKSVATLVVLSKEVVQNAHSDKVERFVASLK